MPVFGVYSPPAPEGGIEGIDELERRLGRRISIVMWYQHWRGWGSQFDPRWVAAAATCGRAPLLTWEPWEPGGAIQPEFRLARIAAGAFDSFVMAWASGLRDLATPIHLRPMHEMNGNWYPWGGTVNGNSAEDFIEAWRRLHDLFSECGAGNVRWVWSPNADDVPNSPDNSFEHYYPGDDYVDVLALDGYNWGSGRREYGGWRTFGQVFAGAYSRLERLGPQPIWVAETASDATGGDKAAWVRDMFAVTAGMPRLEAIVWFDINKERDWRATAPAETADAFRCGPG